LGVEPFGFPASLCPSQEQEQISKIGGRSETLAAGSGFYQANELAWTIHELIFPWEKAGMDSLPKSHYGRFIHPGLLPGESFDLDSPGKIHE